MCNKHTFESKHVEDVDKVETVDVIEVTADARAVNFASIRSI